MTGIVTSNILAIVVVAVFVVVIVVVVVVVVDIADVDCSICKRESKQRQTNPNKIHRTGVGCILVETDIDRNIPATA